MAKISLQFTGLESEEQQTYCTSVLSTLCTALRVKFEIYGAYNDFDVTLPKSEFECLHVLNVLQSYAILNKIGTRVMP